TGVNEKGWVAGSYQDTVFASHGFIRKPNGHVKVISDRAGDVGIRSINADGDVCGYIRNSAFVRDVRGTLTKIHPPKSQDSVATSINDEGFVVGSFDVGVLSHGFLRSPDGTITTFDAPDGANTFPTSINSAGEIAGWYYDTEGLQHAF